MRRLPNALSWSLWLSLFLSSSLGLAAPAAAPVAASAATGRAARAAKIAGLVKASLAQKQADAKGAVADLITHAKGETDPALQKMAVSALLKLKLPLVRAQKTEILGLVRDPVRGLLPKNPPMPAQGTIEVRHYSMNGFLAGDLAQMRQAGFEITQTPGGAEAKLGRLHVVMRETGDDVLRDLADPKINLIVYNGHSQIGGTVEQALEGAGVTGPASRKLVALFQCVGTQTLPLLKTKAPMADVITSNSPLYVAETPLFVRQLYEGINKGENYQRIARRFEQVAWEKGRIVSPNQTATLKNVDFDANGELDVNEKPGEIQILSPRDTLVAQHLMSGVHFLRTLNPYYADETPGAVFTREQASAAVVAKGITKGDGKTVTRIVEREDKGKRAFEISLDSSYEDASPAFVGAATVYELQMHMQKSLINQTGERAQARALAFAGEYLELMPRDQAAAQAALDRLTKMQGLPRLSAWALQSAISGDHILKEDQIDRVAALIKAPQ